MIRAATISALLIAAAALGGCAQAPKPLYHWDGYQRQLYEHLKKDGKTPAEQLGVMEAQAEKARALGAALPPGYRAHMGMLHLELGSFDAARQMLEAEKMAFPESAHYMDFLLKGMSGKRVVSGGTK